MAVDMKQLLSLSQKERRKIAEKLWDSLPPNHAVTELSREEKMLLKKRWERYVAGEMKFHNSNTMQKMVFGKK